MDLRTILAMAQQQQSIPGLLSMLRGLQQQGGNRRRAVPQPVSGGGGGAVPPPVSSTMAASNAMNGSGAPTGAGGGAQSIYSPSGELNSALARGGPGGAYSVHPTTGALMDPMTGVTSWGHDPRVPTGPVTSKNGVRVGVPVEGTDPLTRYKLPDGSFSEPYNPGEGYHWWSDLHRPISDPPTAGSFRPAPQFGPGYYWSTTGELGIPGQGQFATMWGSGGP